MLPVQRAPYLTQEFGRHADIARDLMLRHPLCDQRIFFEELQITLLRRLRHRSIKTLLQHPQGSLYQQPEHPLEGRNSFEKLLLTMKIDGQQLAVLDRLDKKMGRYPLRKTRDIAHPPILYGKKQNGLHSFFIKIIGADTTLDKEGLEIADLPFLQ